MFFTINSLNKGGIEGITASVELRIAGVTRDALSCKEKKKLFLAFPID